ncbi:hypothetical protein [Aneurinibacillus sp. REN35]|uniref:hypothetical protein n=1 Tax=Aneurinibacillus sp. REN35 TaxID=3237286 RepID=UPI003528EF71
MHSLYYFLHIGSLAIWFGGLLSLALVLYTLNKRGGSQETEGIVRSLITIVNWLLNPSALIVMVSGLMMMLNLGLMGQETAFWLRFMQDTGSLIVLLSIGLITFYGNRFKKKVLNQAGADNAKLRKKMLANYVRLMAGSAVLVLGVVLVVSLKIA